MKRFIFKTLSAVLMLYSSLLIIHLMLDHLSTKYVEANSPDVDWCFIEGLSVDELYVGNSRTWVHVDTEKIYSKTKLKSYALAHDGGDIQIVFLKLKKLLKYAELPSRINLQFDPFILTNHEELYGIEKYAPELFLNSSMKTALEGKLGYSLYYYFIPLISYSPERIFKTLIQYNNNVQPNGYHCQELPWESPIDFFDTQYWDTITYESPVFLDSIFSLCHDNNIVINAIIPPLSPSYSSKLNTSYYFKQFIRLSRIYETDGNFYDFSSSINERSYFYNHSHLNCQGASIYTDYLISELYHPLNISTK